MDDTHGARDAAPALTPKQTVFAIAVLIPIVAGYVLLGSAIGLAALYMGFLFSTYWGAVKMLDPSEFLPTALGGLVGIGIAFVLHALPAAIGLPGLLIAVAATIVPLYFMMRQKAALLLNPAFIVFLTVATIPAIGQRNGDYAGMAAALVFGAAYARAIVFVIARLGSLRKGAPAREMPATTVAGRA